LNPLFNAAALPWIATPAVKPSDSVFEGSADGCDIYVDGARFLPDNVTITRATIEVRVLNEC